MAQWHRRRPQYLRLRNRRRFGSLEGFGDVESPYLFALDGQSDREGPVNFDIYAAFNRNITGDRLGVGVRNVTVTLFGPEQ
ncbi:MAG: hypothetical protein R2851_13675 [Caldilineaceae bacterium]